jgi:AcrR family transcriptional regulator
MLGKKTTPPDRMARKKNRTRNSLMQAAIDLLLEKGYEEVVTDEITDLADVGRRTFYNHFVSKQECVLAALQNRYSDYAKELKRSLNSAAFNQEGGECDHALVISTMASQMFRLIAMDPITERLIDYPRILSEAVAESQRDYMLANIANGVVAGRFKPSLPTESLEPIIAWGFVGLVATSIRRKSQEVDSLVWARFVLQNLGVAETEANDLLDTVSA